MSDDPRHPHVVATEYVNRKDEFSEIRERLERHIDRLGGNIWIDRHLAVKDIEDLIDAKISAALRR